MTSLCKVMSVITASLLLMTQLQVRCDVIAADGAAPDGAAREGAAADGAAAGASPPKITILQPKSGSVWPLTGNARQISWTSSSRDHLQDCVLWGAQIMGVPESDPADFPAKEDPEASVPVYIAQYHNSTVLTDLTGNIRHLHVSLPDFIPTGDYVLRLGCSETAVGGDKRSDGEANVTTSESGKFRIVNVGNRTENRLSYERKLWREFVTRRERYRALQRELSPRHVTTDRCHVTTLEKSTSSKKLFWEKCHIPQRPCAVKGAADDWLAMQRWKFDTFEKDPRVTDGVRVGSKQEFIPFSRWNAWRTNTSQDTRTQPMVFMPDVFDVYPAMSDDYLVPDYLSAEDDLMMSLDDELRMDWRWIIMAAKRSGSHFHVDPVNTSAWLAVPVGAKKWGFYPPSISYIPGTKNTNYKQSDYAQIDSYNWWTHTFPFLKEDFRPLECLQRAGDLFFIPGGWWHNILNVADTVAVTQNFVNTPVLSQVVKELAEQADVADKGNFLASTLASLATLYSQSLPRHFRGVSMELPTGSGPGVGEGVQEQTLEEFREERREFVSRLLDA